MLAILSLMLLVQEAAAPPAPLPGLPPTAKGRSNTVTVEDYPGTARQEGAQGNVSVSYRIGADGTVENCKIVASSSNAALDNATCAIATRWRFNPARDAQGTKVPFDQALTIAWRLHDAGCKADVPLNAICISPD